MKLPDRTAETLSGTAPQNPLDWAVQSRDGDMASMVREALARDRAQLAFQPIVTAGQPPQVAFHEGFIRLMDEGGRILPAGLFMDSVEDTGLGREIACASLRLGLQMLRRHQGLRHAINMSARSIGDGEWRRILEAGRGGAAAWATA